MADLRFVTGSEEVDVAKLHQFLTKDSTWAKGITLEQVVLSVQHSLCFSIWQGEQMVAFCRLVTDYATFGNLVDVVVWPDYRGQGLAGKLMDYVVEQEAVKALRRITLATSNAHGLYAKYGFEALDKPETFMQVYRPDIYAT